MMFCLASHLFIYWTCTIASSTVVVILVSDRGEMNSDGSSVSNDDFGHYSSEALFLVTIVTVAMTEPIAAAMTITEMGNSGTTLVPEISIVCSLCG